MAGLSIPEFGGVASPLTNTGAARIDAGWFVDFDQLADVIDIDMTAVVKAGTFSTSPAALKLYASSDPASIAAATLLATLSAADTANAFVGQKLAAVTVANPTGKKHLLLVSVQGV